MFWRLLFVVLPSLFFSSFAFSYTWSNNSGIYGSPDAACRGAFALQMGGLEYVSAVININNGDSPGGNCVVTYKRESGETALLYGIGFARSGNGCEGGGTYEPSTGICKSNLNDGDRCEDQTGGTKTDPMIYDSAAGKCLNFTDSGKKPTCAHLGNLGGSQGYTIKGVLDSTGNAVAPPTSASNLDCEVATISTSDCKINVKGEISCNITGSFTGNVMTTGKDTKPLLCGQNGEKCPDQTPEVKAESSPCSLSGPSSSQSCTATSSTEAEGSQSCGSMNGSYVCVTKQPTSNGTKIDTTVKSTTNGDGSSDVVKTEVGTKTKCTDVKTCTSTTSTTTTTTHTSSTGKTTNSSNCTGSGCKPDGTGITNGGTGGNGDGEGGDDSEASASDDCAKPVVCGGDIIQCAILNQQFLTMCTLRKLPTDKEKADLASSIADENKKIDELQKEMDDKAKGVLDKFKAGSGGGSVVDCLPDYPISGPYGMSLNMKFSAVCPYLSPFRMAMMIVAYLLAARMISKEL